MAAVAVAVTLGATSAQALTVEEILNYKGPDRQKLLEDGARQEGTVFIYSGMIVNQLPVSYTHLTLPTNREV